MRGQRPRPVHGRYAFVILLLVLIASEFIDPPERARPLGDDDGVVASSQARPRCADTERVIVESRLRSRRLAVAVPARLGVRAWLGCLMLGSFLVRGIVAGVGPDAELLPGRVHLHRARALARDGGQTPRPRRAGPLPCPARPAPRGPTLARRLDRHRPPARAVRERALHVACGHPHLPARPASRLRHPLLVRERRLRARDSPTSSSRRSSSPIRSPTRSSSRPSTSA